MRSSHSLSEHHGHIDALKQDTIEHFAFVSRPGLLDKAVNSQLTCILEQSFMCPSCGIVFVTTTASKHALLILDIAGPEKMPCVRIAYTFVAPASISFSAAWQMVPQVSAMSSTRIATRSFTSPTSTMDATSLAFFRSLWIRANSTFSLSAVKNV